MGSLALQELGRKWDCLEEVEDNYRDDQVSDDGKDNFSMVLEKLPVLSEEKEPVKTFDEFAAQDLESKVRNRKRRPKRRAPEEEPQFFLNQNQQNQYVGRALN